MSTGLIVSPRIEVQYELDPYVSSFLSPQPQLVCHRYLHEKKLCFLAESNTKKQVYSDMLHNTNIFGSSKRAPWTAEVRSGSVTLTLLLDDTSLFTDKAFSFFFFLLDVLLALQSPHMLVPPCVEGMFRKVMPWSVGPSERFKGTPSHCNWRQ